MAFGLKRGARAEMLQTAGQQGWAAVTNRRCVTALHPSHSSHPSHPSHHPQEGSWLESPTISDYPEMTLKETFDSFRTDLRELKAAAHAHNVAPYDSSPGPTKSPEGASGSTSRTSDKPSSASPETPLPSNAPVTQSEPPAAFIPPPPPPKNLPHGWTARYDEKESKFCYSHGVDSKKEQWDFRKEPRI